MGMRDHICEMSFLGRDLLVMNVVVLVLLLLVLPFQPLGSAGFVVSLLALFAVIASITLGVIIQYSCRQERK